MDDAEYSDPTLPKWWETKDGLTLVAVVSWGSFLAVGSGVAYGHIPNVVEIPVALIAVGCLVLSLVTSGKASVMAIDEMAQRE